MKINTARWTKPIALTAVGVALLIGASAVREHFVADAERKQHPPPGRLVQVGDHRMHIYCTGPRGSGPTVVLESGLGGWSGLWPLQQPAIAKEFRVCAYDRAGYGWSEPGPLPRNVVTQSRELHGLLAASGEPGPYVLVGASLGGSIVRMHQHLYPAEVSGLVLLDPAHEDDVARLGAQYASRLRPQHSWLDRQKPLLARLGISRLGKLLAPSIIPKDQIGPLFATLLKPAQVQAKLDEEDAWLESDRLMHQTGRLDALPLVVVGATKGGPPEILAARQKLLAELAALSSRGRHLAVPGMDHSSFVFEPKYAAVVNQAILDVARQAREPAAPGR